MPLTRRQAEAEGRKEEVEKEYEEAIGHMEPSQRITEGEKDETLGKHDLSSPEDEELRKKSRNEENLGNFTFTELITEIRASIKAELEICTKAWEEKMDAKLEAKFNNKNKQVDMMETELNSTITEVQAISEKLVYDEQKSQELAKNQDLKMEDILSKNKFLYQHVNQIEVNVRSELEKYTTSINDITKHVNDHEEDNKRVIEEIKENLIVQQATVDNQHARTLKTINEQLEQRVRILNKAVNDNLKEITIMKASEEMRRNDYDVLKEDMKKLNIAKINQEKETDSLKNELNNEVTSLKSQDREQQNYLRNKMEEQNAKIIVLQQQKEHLLENISSTKQDHRIFAQKMEKEVQEIAKDFAVLTMKCELNMSSEEKPKNQTLLSGTSEKRQEKKYGNKEDEKEEELYTPAHKYQEYEREENLKLLRPHPYSSTFNDVEKDDDTITAMAEKLNNVVSTSDERMIWNDMRIMLATMTEHKPAYWDKVKKEIDMKLTDIDILKPSFRYKKDGSKYHAETKGIPKLILSDCTEYKADLVDKLITIGTSLRTEKIKFSDWGIILRENFLDKLLKQEIRITLKPHKICDNPWSLLVFLLFRNSKIMFTADTRQEAALNVEPKPDEELATYLTRLTLISTQFTEEPNTVFKNRIATILQENQCWIEMDRLRDVNTYQDYLRNFRKIPFRLPGSPNISKTAASFTIKSEVQYPPRRLEVASMCCMQSNIPLAYAWVYRSMQYQHDLFYRLYSLYILFFHHRRKLFLTMLLFLVVLLLKQSRRHLALIGNIPALIIQEQMLRLKR